MEKHINNNGYDYVDLCLPSGALWATMNVGADKPIDCGLYFQWGDTVGYTKEQVGIEKLFNRVDYKLNPSGDGKTFTKYKTTGEALALEDDAAHIQMGGDWYIPSPEQIQELIDNTEASFITSNDGISGMMFTSKKDASKSIFFPFAGYALYDSIDWVGDYAGIWTSMLSVNGINYGKYFYFYSEGGYPNECSRYNGFSVRGVIDGKCDDTKEIKDNTKSKKMEDRQKVYIKGDTYRGDEVIKALTDLGGSNPTHYYGNDYNGY